MFEGKRTATWTVGNFLDKKNGEKKLNDVRSNWEWLDSISQSHHIFKLTLTFLFFIFN